MSDEVKYLDYEGLQEYNAEIVSKIDGKANASHNHSAANITSGTLSSDRLPTVPLTKGGTGATTAAGALKNLGLTATAAELNYMDGVTSNVQTQLNGKAASGHTHNYAGSSSAGGAANSANKLNRLNARPSSADIAVTGDGSMTHYLASSSMTTNKPPNGDGHILNFEWDSTAGWTTQLSLSHTHTPCLAIRGMSSGTWGDWHTVLDSNNYNTYAAAKSHNHSASNITSGTLPIARGGTGATTAAGILTNAGVTATAAELNKLDGVTATTAELNYVDGVTSNIQTQLNGKAASSHTHNYAGSSSAGGSATSAVKLDKATSGSATRPVYFTGGNPAACTYTLGKSVPSNAVFTDTVEVYVQATEPTSPNAKIWIQTT